MLYEVITFPDRASDRSSSSSGEKPPCVKVCPVRTTYREGDGPVVIDYNWCIGCRYCAAACPYQARFFNWRAPTVPPQDLNPDQGYLSNRLRPAA